MSYYLLFSRYVRAHIHTSSQGLHVLVYLSAPTMPPSAPTVQEDHSVLNIMQFHHIDYSTSPFLTKKKNNHCIDILLLATFTQCTFQQQIFNSNLYIYNISGKQIMSSYKHCKHMNQQLSFSQPNSNISHIISVVRITILKTVNTV